MHRYERMRTEVLSMQLYGAPPLPPYLPAPMYSHEPDDGEGVMRVARVQVRRAPSLSPPTSPPPSDHLAIVPDEDPNTGLPPYHPPPVYGEEEEDEWVLEEVHHRTSKFGLPMLPRYYPVPRYTEDDDDDEELDTVGRGGRVQALG